MSAPAGARLFVALELPGAARRELAAWGRAAAAADPALRAVREDALHVTLVFLGEQDPGAVGAIAGALRCAAPGDAPCGLTVTRASWLPARRPRVLAAELAAPPALLALQRRLAAALAAWRAPERRPFRPHVTVARVRRGARPAAGAPSPPVLAIACGPVVLYRSRPGPGGAAYEPLARG